MSPQINWNSSFQVFFKGELDSKLDFQIQWSQVLDAAVHVYVSLAPGLFPGSAPWLSSLAQLPGSAAWLGLRLIEIQVFKFFQWGTWFTTWFLNSIKSSFGCSCPCKKAHPIGGPKTSCAFFYTVFIVFFVVFPVSKDTYLLVVPQNIWIYQELLWDPSLYTYICMHT